MTAGRFLKRGLDEVWKAWREKRHDRALEEVNLLLETRADNAQLLVLRGCLIQLQDNAESLPPLVDALKDLKRAVALDHRSPEAWLELGYYFHAVEDDPGAAAKCFQKAVRLSKGFLRQALIGQAEALAELDQNDEALDRFMEAYSLASRNGKSGRLDLLERLKSIQRSN